MATVDDWYNLVMPSCVGISTEIFRSSVMRAAIEFCKDTQVLQEELPQITLVSGTAEYTVGTTDADEEVFQIQKVRKVNDGGVLPPTTREDLDRGFGDWEANEGLPSAYLCDEPTTLTVYPIPDDSVDEKLIVRIVRLPSFGAAGLDDKLLRDYKDIIAEGAIYYASSVPSSPSFSPEFAGIKYKLFRSGIGGVRKSRAKGFTNRPLRMRAGRFGI